MRVAGLDLSTSSLHGPLPMAHALVDAAHWSRAAHKLHEQGARLIALWAGGAGAPGEPGTPEGTSVSAAFATSHGALWLQLPLRAQDGRLGYPDLQPWFFTAARLQRAARDLGGIHPEGFADSRTWLNHGAWNRDYAPLRDTALAPPPPEPLQDYAFVPVQGEGVHEIPVGPVHAGIIEPGHFRFSVVGEKVLRLEQRLGYVHKGIEQRMTTLPPLQAHRLAGRVSGDSTVAYAWAYCMALESACHAHVSARAATLRALLLERERVANHLGDLGALANDAAFAFGLAQFSRLREDWLRGAKAAFGHRLAMDVIVPGGVSTDLGLAECDALARLCDRVEHEVRALQALYEDHPGLQDRFRNTGRVAPSLAAQLGLVGMAGRASGQWHDLRCEYPGTLYRDPAPAMAQLDAGDVAARVAVRFFEVFESLRLVRHWCLDLPKGKIQTPLRLPQGTARGAGWVEGWRGPVWVALELGHPPAHGNQGAPESAPVIHRCHLHDPSWHNWPALEHAIMGNIVPDFPLINKSFNLSYSGQDL